MARKKKHKGFKVQDSFVCYNDNNRKFLLALSHYYLEKGVKDTHIPSKKCATEPGEYCPKITGCCWDYTKKKGEDKNVA